MAFRFGKLLWSARRACPLICQRVLGSGSRRRSSINKWEALMRGTLTCHSKRYGFFARAGRWSIHVAYAGQINFQDEVSSWMGLNERNDWGDKQASGGWLEAQERIHDAVSDARACEDQIMRDDRHGKGRQVRPSNIWCCAASLWFTHARSPVRRCRLVSLAARAAPCM